MTGRHNNQKQLIKDLEILEKMTTDTNIGIHISRVADLARGGYYHMKESKTLSYLDEAFNEGNGVYRP